MNEITSKTIQITIPEDHQGKRLDQSLAILLPDYSRTQIKDWIDQGLVLVNHAQLRAKDRLNGGEDIEVTTQVKEQPSWEAQQIPLNIVYEDEQLMVINKPAGLVVHPGAGNSDLTMLNAILHHCPDSKDLPRAGILHRLDKDTTGLLVVAKTAAALKSLNDQLKARSMIREYQAIVYGEMISGGKVEAPISRHPSQRIKMAVVADGKEALTHYRVAERLGKLTRLKLKLETGRTHQIRVHMSHIKHPIVGDAIYGGRVQLSKGMHEEAIQQLRQFSRQALHAFALSFTHPETGEIKRFEADLPDDMQALLKELRIYAKGTK